MGNVSHLAFSLDGRRLASGDMNGLVSVWNVRTRSRLALLKGHLVGIGFLAFSKDARSLASGDTGRTLKIWNLDQPHGERLLPEDAAGVPRLAFSPDGRALASAGSASRIRDARSGAQAWSSDDEDRDPQAGASTTALAFAADGRLLATGDRSSRVVVRDSATGRPLLVLEGMPREFYGPPSPLLAMATPEYKRAVSSIAFSPDGTILAAGYGILRGFIPRYGQVIKLWDPRSGRLLQTLHTQNTVSSLHFTNRGRTLGAAGHDGTFRTWNVEGWGEAGTVRAGSGIVSSAVSSDGTLMAMGLIDGTVVARDLAAGLEVIRVSGHAGMVVGVAFSPDGRTLASLGPRDLKFWDVATGSEMLSLKLTYPAFDLAFHPAGDLLGLATTKGVRLMPAMPLDRIDAELAADPDRAR